ncbi:MAG TPA: hypothetical protein VMN56_20960 [Casimicrobiaceae bacterium]|nr:hypothetical protein [Casimicrobiaceae bacterium]
MAQILVAQFDDFEGAEAVAHELRSIGVAKGDTEIFALNPPGQHAQYPIGGDEDADRGAREGDTGAVAGAALGGAAGLALGAVAVPVVGPLAVAAGAAVGAYTGALAGAVKTLGDDKAAPAPRPAGVRLAVNVLTPAHREHVLSAFRRHAARSIEEAQGIWRDAGWSDFDPVSVPHWIEPPAQYLS